MPRAREIPRRPSSCDESPDCSRLVPRGAPHREPAATEYERLLGFAREACRRHARLGDEADFRVSACSQALRCAILHCRVNGKGREVNYVLKWRANAGRWVVAHEYESLCNLHTLSRRAGKFLVIEPVAYSVSPAALLTVQAAGESAHRYVRRACRRTASAGDRESVLALLDRAADWLVELQQLTQASPTSDEARASADGFLEDWRRLFDETVAGRLSPGAVRRIEGLMTELLDTEMQSPRSMGVHGDFGLGQLLACPDGSLRGLDFELYDMALVSTDAGQQRITLEYMAANPWWSRRALEEMWNCFAEALIRRGVSSESLLLGYLVALPRRMTVPPRRAGNRAALLLRSWRHRRWLHSRYPWLEQLADCASPDAACKLFAGGL